MSIKELSKPFPHDFISWRVGATNQKRVARETNNSKARPTKGIALAYIDARDVMDRLDEVCGVGNWQNEYPYKGCCRIGIKVDGEWVWKSNGAGETQVEADKGQYSDSFKRAAVQWGIGRYLYDCPNVWVDLDDWGGIKDPNDPRLNEALKKAESGARPIAETIKPLSNPPVQKVQKITADEANQYKEELWACKNMDELKAEWSKIYEIKSAMTKAQFDVLEGVKDNRKAELEKA